MNIKLIAIKFFFILSVHLYSQSNDIINIDKIPDAGLVIDKGWKWNQEDNPAFASTEYNDSDWQSIDPLADITQMYPTIQKGKIGWLRVKIKISQFPTQSIGCLLLQAGATEIYLNGIMIQKYGVLDPIDHSKIKAYNPAELPFSMPLSRDSIQIIAIRYGMQISPKYVAHFGYQNPVLKMTLKPINTAITERANFIAQNVSRVYAKASLFGILTILFFSLFLFFPDNKVNLFFSIYTFFLCICWSSFESFTKPSYLDRAFWLGNMILFVQAIGFIFLLSAVYKKLNTIRGWQYYFLLTLGLVSSFTGYSFYGWGWMIFGYIFILLVALDILRVSRRAIRNNIKGAWILTIGGLIYFVCWFIFNLQFGGFIPRDSILTPNLFDISMLVMCVSFAIFLGYENGLTNKLLVKKLNENEKLSAEKQEILALQNETLENQVTERTAALNTTLKNLQSTQSQLIQSEKMASLGELTAGIAHEIQNPLNFVNNFSELNGELIKELEEEARSEKRDTKNEAELLSAIKENSEKINHHGKRAESIVKGMLEHSRKSSGVKEPTDINKLCDEFVRLSYHGLRAKDKNLSTGQAGFNSDYKLDLDPNLPLVNVVSQDIGRVILNIVNNAFQACFLHSESGKSESQEKYKPLVTLTTKFSASLRLCEICITDNGPGIPTHIKDKIFQPFFTTKPTGQGTGLGLSLAYDIVKAHGGSIEVKSNYYPPGGEIEVKSNSPSGGHLAIKSSHDFGSEFIITLPFEINEK